MNRFVRFLPVGHYISLCCMWSYLSGVASREGLARRPKGKSNLTNLFKSNKSFTTISLCLWCQSMGRSAKSIFWKIWIYLWDFCHEVTLIICEIWLAKVEFCYTVTKVIIFFLKPQKQKCKSLKCPILGFNSLRY